MKLIFLLNIPLLGSAINSNGVLPTNNHLRARMLQRQPPTGGAGGDGGTGRTTVCSTTVAPSFGTVTPGTCLTLT